MSRTRNRIAAAVAGVLAVGATAAWADTPASDRIAELEAKVAALESKQAASSRDMATTIESVLRDAERRSHLLANSADMSAGYKDGFFIRAGEDWELRPYAQFQFRHIANHRQDVGGDDDEIENGFEVRRMKLGFAGTAVTKDLSYQFQWATDRGSGLLVLEDAYVKYMMARPWGIRMGQFKDPVHHEELVSSTRQLAVERSLVNELLGGGVTDRTQGVSLIYGDYAADNPINAEVVIHDGFDEENTNFVDASFDWGVGGRVEWKAMGDWKNYRDFSAKGNEKDLLVLGAGGDWSQIGDGDILIGTADAQWENTGGLGVYGAVLVMHTDSDLAIDDTTDWGAVGQVGYMLAPAWEVFGRYDVIIYDDEIVAAGDEDTFHEITAGVNYFLGKDGSAHHKAKFTVDLTYLPNGSPDDVTGSGVLDLNDGEEEWILRAQFQLVI